MRPRDPRLDIVRLKEHLWRLTNLAGFRGLLIRFKRSSEPKDKGVHPGYRQLSRTLRMLKCLNGTANPSRCSTFPRTPPAFHSPQQPGVEPHGREYKDTPRPYGGYSVDDLYQFLSSYTLRREPGSEIEYSNLGAGLLGHVLACRAGTDYETLLRSRITQPLNMPDTGITFAPSMKQRMASGHKGNLLPATK